MALVARQILMRWRQVLALAALAVSLSYFVVRAQHPLSFAVTDIGALALGTPDEHELALGIHHMAHERTLDYRIPEYPGFYPLLGSLSLRFSGRFIGQGERIEVLTLRCLSLAFAMLAIAMVFALGWAVSRDVAVGAGAATILCLSPEFFYWSVRIHPDTLLLSLLAFSQLALIKTFERKSTAWLDLAVVGIGLATCTKLVGLFLMPLVLLACAQLERSTWARLRRLVRVGFILALIAMLTTPMLSVNLFGIFANLTSVWDVTRTAVAPAPRLGWLSVLGAHELLGPAMTCCAGLWLLGLLLAVLRLGKRSRWSLIDRLDPRPTRSWSLAVFVVTFLGYLMVTTHLFETRYAFPLLPALVTGVACVLLGPASLPLPASWPTGPVRAVATVITLALFAHDVPKRLEPLTKGDTWVRNLSQDPRLEVGAWLEQNAKPCSRIIFDYGVYVPLHFRNATLTWGLSRQQVEGTRPEWILIQYKRRMLFMEDAPGLGEEGTALHRDRVATLASLQQGQLFGFQNVMRFEAAGITVYRDPTAPACDPACN